LSEYGETVKKGGVMSRYEELRESVNCAFEALSSLASLQNTLQDPEKIETIHIWRGRLRDWRNSLMHEMEEYEQYT
jgi:hypothetical protein